MHWWKCTRKSVCQASSSSKNKIYWPEAIESPKFLLSNGPATPFLRIYMSSVPKRELQTSSVRESITSEMMINSTALAPACDLRELKARARSTDRLWVGITTEKVKVLAFMNFKSISQNKTLKLNKAQPYRLSKTHGASSTRNRNKQKALKLASTVAKNAHTCDMS